MTSIDRRAALAIISGTVGALVANPDLRRIASLAPKEVAQANAAASGPDSAVGTIQFSQGSRGVETARANGAALRGAIETGTFQLINPDLRSSEVEDKRFASHVDFTLRAIGKGGKDVTGAYYKVQGDGNNGEYYLYQASSNQVQHDGDTSKYENNTKVVAKYTLQGKDAEGKEIWKREDLNQPSAVIKGNLLNREDCKDQCPDALIKVTETDSQANPIPGGEVDNFRVRDIKPYVLCDRWGNWLDNPEPVTPTPTATTAPTATATATLPPAPAQLPRTGDKPIEP